MPIKPENKSLYPKDWPQISKAIRERAEHRCEFCGINNYEVGARDKKGKWHSEHSINGMKSDDGIRLFGDFPKMKKIVLTVAHLDHDPRNCDPANLRALCQQCHLRYDTKHHSETSAKTREKKRGLRSLFER